MANDSTMMVLLLGGVAATYYAYTQNMLASFGFPYTAAGVTSVPVTTPVVTPVTTAVPVTTPVAVPVTTPALSTIFSSPADIMARAVANAPYILVAQSAWTGTPPTANYYDQLTDQGPAYIRSDVYNNLVASGYAPAPGSATSTTVSTVHLNAASGLSGLAYGIGGLGCMTAIFEGC